MQTNLLGEKKTPVKIKESYGGFEVINSGHIDFGDVQVKPFRMGKVIVKQFNSYELAKESFEKECRVAYQTDVVWKKSKFQDSEGVFWLDGVEIKWELKANWVGDMYHMEFKSYDEKNKGIPNILTDTGYRSHFSSNLDCYKSIKDYLIDLMEHEINCDEKGKPNKRLKKYKLEWKDTGYKPNKQFTLTEMKGGEK